MIKINGHEYELKEIKLMEYLNNNGYDIKKIAIELNGEILKKSDYAECILVNGDKVEIVCFVGGG